MQQAWILFFLYAQPIICWAHVATSKSHPRFIHEQSSMNSTPVLKEVIINMSLDPRLSADQQA